MTEYNTLRAANIARQTEWLAGKTLPMSFRTNEMAGELGEVAELLLDRWPKGGHMYVQWKQALADELADVVICGDLVMHGVNCPQQAPVHKEDWLGYKHLLGYMLKEMGLACNAAKKADRMAYGIAGGVSEPYDIIRPVASVVQHIYDIAINEQINMEVSIARKFNHTSKKVGLQTLFVPPGYDRALLIP